MTKIRNLPTDAEQLPFGFIIPTTDPGGAGKRKRDVRNHISPLGSNPTANHLVGEWNFSNATVIFHTKNTMRTAGGYIEFGGALYGDGFKNDSETGETTFTWGGNPGRYEKGLYGNLLNDDSWPVILMARLSDKDPFVNFARVTRVETNYAPFKTKDDMRPIVKFRVYRAPAGVALSYPDLF
jgi:hypothetical protein